MKQKKFYLSVLCVSILISSFAHAYSCGEGGYTIEGCIVFQNNTNENIYLSVLMQNNHSGDSWKRFSFPYTSSQYHIDYIAPGSSYQNDFGWMIGNSPYPGTMLLAYSIKTESGPVLIGIGGFSISTDGVTGADLECNSASEDSDYSVSIGDGCGGARGTITISNSHGSLVKSQSRVD